MWYTTVLPICTWLYSLIPLFFWIEVIQTTTSPSISTCLSRPLRVHCAPRNYNSFCSFVFVSLFVLRLRRRSLTLSTPPQCRCLSHRPLPLLVIGHKCVCVCRVSMFTLAVRHTHWPCDQCHDSHKHTQSTLSSSLYSFRMSCSLCGGRLYLSTLCNMFSRNQKKDDGSDLIERIAPSLRETVPRPVFLIDHSATDNCHVLYFAWCQLFICTFVASLSLPFEVATMSSVSITRVYLTFYRNSCQKSESTVCIVLAFKWH